MSDGEALSGGTVSLPVRPKAEGFGAELSKVLLGQSGTISGAGKEMAKKFLAGFAIFEVAKTIADGVSDSIKTAVGAEAATAQLQQTVKNAGFEYETYADQVEAAQDAGRKFGFTNEDTTKALTQLTLGLKDPAEALKVLGVAQDLAVAKNMDLSSAALLVTKGMEGQTRPLKALGIDLPVFAGNAQAVALAQDKVTAAQNKVNAVLAEYPNAVNAGAAGHEKYETALNNLSTAQDLLNQKSSSGEQILQALSDRLGGSASAAADTLAGKQAALSAGFDDVKEKVGVELMPVLGDLVDFGNDTLVPGLQATITWVGKYSDVLGPAATAVGVLTVAAWGLDAALDANPIGAVTAGIVGVTAAIVALQTNVGGSGVIVHDTLNDIWQFAGSVGIGIAGAVQTAANGIIDVINVLEGPLNTILAAFGRPPIKISHVDFTSNLVAGLAAFANADQLFDLNAASGGSGVAVGSGAKNAGAARALAAGGTVMPTPGGTLVKIAEAGRPETVVDTESLNRVAELASGGGGGGNTFQVYNPDPYVVVQMLMQKLKTMTPRAATPGMH